MVRCLVLPLLHRSLTYPTQSATHDQGKYCGQRRCQTGNYDHVEVIYGTGHEKYINVIHAPQKSDFNSMKFSRESRGYFPGFHSREKCHFPGNSREATLLLICHMLCKNL